jgi:two-component system C4-dicarboxylate transport sensor histidine kinase DctB
MMPIRRISLIFTLAFVLFSIIGSRLVWNFSYQQLLNQHHLELERFSSHIATRLDKYAHLPRLLARDRKLIEALQHRNNPAQIDLTNRYLHQINETIGASDTYLLDVEANTIAASNWNSDHSFVGRNFLWRPYFANAIKGNNSQYYALGSTSGQRGYYYSAPIIYAAETLGVVVVKMDLSAIEENWQSDNSYFVATDPNNIVFMSSKPEWLFNSIAPLSEASLQAIMASRQYLNQPIPSLNLSGDLNSPQAEWENKRRGWIRGDYIVTSRILADVSLNIRVLTPKIEVFWDSFAFVILSAMGFSIAYLIALLYQHRQLKQRQFAQLQAEAKQKLEYLVMERTSELHAEIHQRSKTEQQLRKTQGELIQAAKLAVLGQMSASISHELNNPLAAIRSFADNGRRFLSAGKIERVDDNLARISSLTERMAQISTQLKSFARKSDDDNLSQVQLSPLILSAKELMAGQFKSQLIDFTFDLAPQPIHILVNPIQLEQVLINLLTNAMQATAENDTRQIRLSVEKLAEQVSIHIDDNGSGISDSQRQTLFEPFFTTKKNGLGLGLSISQQIIENMNGKISAGQSQLGGARFTITLPL